MLIRNITRNTSISGKCDIADNFITRFLGLMGTKELLPGSGLLITPCNSIHMFFMRFPLDIIFIDKECTVVFLVENIKPWSVTRLVWKAYSTIELPIGVIEKSKTSIGDKLLLEG